MRIQFEYPRAYYDAWSRLTKSNYSVSSNAEEMWIDVHETLGFADRNYISSLHREEAKQREAEGRA